MDYRRNIVSNDEERSRQFKVYDSLNELVDETLCDNQGNEFPSECLQSSCRHSGTKRFQFQEESTRTDSSVGNNTLIGSEREKSALKTHLTFHLNVY